MKKASIIESKISLGRMEEVRDQIFSLARDRQSSYTCCVNVHMLVESYQDPAFMEVVNDADIATADGMPLCKTLQYVHGIDQERVPGMDLFPLLLQKASEEKLNVFFLGDTDDTLEQLIHKVKEEHPGIQIAGAYSPPFRPSTPEEDAALIERINQSGTNLLFVALGCPKQEKWMAQHRGLVQASMVGIGNAFRTYLGLEKRPPEWVQKIAMEWFYRLIQNPRRLWKRYFYTNGLFLVLFTQYYLLNLTHKGKG